MARIDRRTLLRLAPLAALAALRSGRARAQQQVPLRVGYISIFPMTQLFVMEGRGWTRGVGLQLILKRFSSGPPMVEALAAGALDVAYIGIGPAMLARARGVDVKVVAANVIEQVALVGRGALVEAFAAMPAPAAAFARFRETARRPARIATLPRGAVPDTVLRHYLQEVARIDDRDVEILGMGEDEVQARLLAGTVDAGSIVEPILTTVLVRDRSARILASPARMMPQHPGAVVLVTSAVIAQNRVAVAKLVDLHVKATEAVRADPDKATADIVEFLGRGMVDPAVMRRALTSEATNLIADPGLIVEATRLLQAYQQRFGAQPTSIDIDALFDFSFYKLAVGRG
ncbi:MAG: ABC transporter substrate-binding protein [Proteobacteria bacterium]|nr:ABC transporter substrate-binding protein [Pseudomonadota bacterium]